MRFPVTAALLAAALAALCAPAELLAYDRAAVGRGELWRLFGGQLVHWTGRQAAVDLAAAAAACAALERRSRGTAAAALLAALAAVAAAVHWAPPAFERYRGSSGLAAGLVAALCTNLLITGGRAARALAAVLFLLFAAKLAREAATGAALAAGPLPETVAVATGAHLAGALAGAAAAALAALRRARAQREGNRGRPIE